MAQVAKMLLTKRGTKEEEMARGSEQGETSRIPNPNAKDSDGSTPLHWAARSGHVEVVRCLVEGGADKNVVTSNGSTPLHLAADNGHVEVVRFLVEGGADKNVVDSDGRTPLQLASSDEVKRLLEL